MQLLASFLPVWVVMFPMVMAVVIYYVEQRSEKMRNAQCAGRSHLCSYLPFGSRAVSGSYGW